MTWGWRGKGDQDSYCIARLAFSSVQTKGWKQLWGVEQLAAIYLELCWQVKTAETQVRKRRHGSPFESHGALNVSACSLENSSWILLLPQPTESSQLTVHLLCEAFHNHPKPNQFFIFPKLILKAQSTVACGYHHPVAHISLPLFN